MCTNVPFLNMDVRSSRLEASTLKAELAISRMVEGEAHRSDKGRWFLTGLHMGTEVPTRVGEGTWEDLSK